jgi:uncharacterized protein YjbJ (UPF0337 family)
MMTKQDDGVLRDALNRGVKRIGRPTKPPKAGERVTLGLRVTPEIKNKLEKVAIEKGRSLSQEAEFRLERSFDREALADETRQAIHSTMAEWLGIQIEQLLKEWLKQLPKEGFSIPGEFTWEKFIGSVKQQSGKLTDDEAEEQMLTNLRTNFGKRIKGNWKQFTGRDMRQRRKLTDDEAEETVPTILSSETLFTRRSPENRVVKKDRKDRARQRKVLPRGKQS